MNKQPRPKQEVVVITGASAGVGRATALEFARHGASVGLIARDVARLERARAEVEEAGGRALVVPVDVSEAEQLELAAARIEEELGEIDIWVNNAMVSVFSPFSKMTPDEFRRVTEVTYLGYVHGTMSALKHMLPRNRGTIVQVGSALARRGIPLQSAYCGAKHAIEGFTESLRTELIHDGSHVQLTVVHLPAVNTPQFAWVKSRLERKAQPVPPIYQPEVPARAIHWAAHHPRRTFAVGLSTDVAIQGEKFFPGIGDHYLARTGYDSQQTDEPEDPNRPDNLWAPVPGPFGAHGAFDDRAMSHSPYTWLKMHKGLALLAGAGLTCGAYLATRKETISAP